jgi:hypothetical protein
MASLVYNSAKVKLGNGSINWPTDTIKMALVTSAYTPSATAHTFFSDITNEVAATGGYTAGGFTLAGCTDTQDNTNNRAIYAATDFSQSALTTAFRYAVIYKSTGTPSTSPLICVIDFGSTQTLTSYILQIALNAGIGGIFTLN